jgi:hypothetical protein
MKGKRPTMKLILLAVILVAICLAAYPPWRRR